MDERFAHSDFVDLEGRNKNRCAPHLKFLLIDNTY